MDGVLAFLGGLKHELSMVYGQAGTGKTTLALQAAVMMAREKKKTLFLDTEGGFSVERLQQMAGETWTSLLDQIVVMRIANFAEQYDRLFQMASLAKGFGLVVVDTIGHWYRQELKRDVLATNKLMDRQLRFLFEMARHVPVILTNQVYADVVNNKIATVGGAMILKWCSKVIELQKEPRMIVMHKPEEKRVSFTIADCGLLLS